MLLPNVFRGRQDDDKWEHDLFDDDEPQISSMLLAVTFLCLLEFTFYKSLNVHVYFFGC